jgi:hypothetical protein
MHDRPAKYHDNNDGDSVVMILDQGFYDTKRIKIRLANVWAPEGHEPGGDACWRFVHDWFMRNMTMYGHLEWPFMVITHVTKNDTEKMTLGRFVADVMTIDGKHHLNADVMQFIAERGYSGGIGSPAKPEVP